MWRPSAASCSACAFIFDTVVTRRGLQCFLHKLLLRVRKQDSTARRALRIAVSCRSVHVWVTDPTDARRRFYFGKIQIWNGWYSRLESELHRLTPFLELDCACALSLLPVLYGLPCSRVARSHLVLRRWPSRGGYFIDFLEMVPRRDLIAQKSIVIKIVRAKSVQEERRNLALR